MNIEFTIKRSQTNLNNRQFLNAITIFEYILKGETNWAFGYTGWEKNWPEYLMQLYEIAKEARKSIDESNH